MTTKSCEQCHHYFIGLKDEVLCPKCENQTELLKASRKRGDKEKLMDFHQLLDSWKKLRKEKEQWRKDEGRVTEYQDYCRKLEHEKSLLLIAVNAMECDQNLLRNYVRVNNQLNAMTNERNRFKESSVFAAQRAAEIGRENMKLRMEITRLTIDNSRLRYSIDTRTSRTTSIPAFTKEMWRRFTQLCHPDKHENSVAANEATRWLLENRP